MKRVLIYKEKGLEKLEVWSNLKSLCKDKGFLYEYLMQKKFPILYKRKHIIERYEIKRADDVGKVEKVEKVRRLFKRKSK